MASKTAHFYLKKRKTRSSKVKKIKLKRQQQLAKRKEKEAINRRKLYKKLKKEFED